MITLTYSSYNALIMADRFHYKTLCAIKLRTFITINIQLQRIMGAIFEFYIAHKIKFSCRDGIVWISPFYRILLEKAA